MGYSGKLREKLKAQALRRKGYSYNEILEHVSAAKSTLSSWCKDIELSPKQMERLHERSISGQKKGSVIAAKNKQLKRWAEEKRLRELGIKEVGQLVKKQRFVAGVALYAGDGDKYDDHIIGFTNSDPKLIRFMMCWFREFCKVPEEKFRGSLWIHENLDEAGAKEFWSSLTGIPTSRFTSSYIARNKVDSKKVRKKKHQHGVFSIRFYDTLLKRRLNGWMEGLLSE